MQTFRLPSSTNLVHLVDKIKMAIQNILEISDVESKNNEAASQYEIRIGLRETPIAAIQYSVVEDESAPESDASFDSIEIDDAQIDEDRIIAFLEEIGLDRATSINEQRHIVLKRGMLEAFQKTLKESKKKAKHCKKCGYMYPTYRGSRSQCPVCGIKMGADSIVWPYRAVELSSDRGAEATGAPPPAPAGDGGAMGESYSEVEKMPFVNRGNYVVALVASDIPVAYYTAGSTKDQFDPTAWSSIRKDAATFSEQVAQMLEGKLLDHLAQIAEIEGWEEEDLEIVAMSAMRKK